MALPFSALSFPETSRDRRDGQRDLTDALSPKRDHRDQQLKNKAFIIGMRYALPPCWNRSLDWTREKYNDEIALGVEWAADPCGDGWRRSGVRRSNYVYG